MRLDKFLKVCFVIKRRSLANEVSSEGAVFVNGKAVKPSYTVKEGDLITLNLWNYEKVVKVLKVPTSNSIKKNDLENYIEIVSYRTKSLLNLDIEDDSEGDIF
ncbi:MAG: RNA-binding S4 domain-containing protein [Calditerrivibrio sp.]|nr:RNA-binding S4 domain-containing protein [Calditerrivibrio sp.]MCA1931953.1 RNA-binding S4 domain-containing protein [Calditerrivibrio sp.]